jgi:predicted nucleic acid-binding protein
MIIVDTSVWADHIRKPDVVLSELLAAGDVLVHRFVIEELACGHLPKRSEFLQTLHALPQAPIASHDEILGLLSNKKLYGTGLGSVDVHLIASAMLANAKLLTRDKALAREAKRLNVAS